MPDEDKKMVPIDTSGPDATIDIEEKKDEAVIEQPEEKNDKNIESRIKNKKQLESRRNKYRTRNKQELKTA